MARISGNLDIYAPPGAQDVAHARVTGQVTVTLEPGERPYEIVTPDAHAPERLHLSVDWSDDAPRVTGIWIVSAGRRAPYQLHRAARTCVRFTVAPPPERTA